MLIREDDVRCHGNGFLWTFLQLRDAISWHQTDKIQHYEVDIQPLSHYRSRLMSSSLFPAAVSKLLARSNNSRSFCHSADTVPL